MPLPHSPNLATEYRRLQALAAAEGDHPGRATVLNWDLEYTSPWALCAFVDQILHRRMNDFLPDGDRPVILDCGANIGYTVLYYKRQFPGAHITAFEPDPQFSPILRRNLTRNAAEDVHIVEAAAWTADGRASWAMEAKDGSRLVGVQACDAPVVEVATVDLAAYLQQDVDLLKLDIEGAEFEVVPHLEGRLDRVKNILVECHIVNQASYEGLGRVLATLATAGFTISLNTYGPWRDLTRRHVAAPFHAEQYLLVAGWRAEPEGVSREETYVPYVGLSLHDTIIDPVGAQNERLSCAVAGLVHDPDAWTVHPMTGPFLHNGGRCWTWRLPCAVARGDTFGRSEAPTIVLEDDRVLGPGRALHDDIRMYGSGRYSHWESHLYLSASDNSDPNTNGRQYTAICRRARASLDASSKEPVDVGNGV